MKRALMAAFVLARMLPPSKIEAISSNVASGLATSRVSELVSSNEARQALVEYLDAVNAEGISAEVAAAMLMSSSHTCQGISGEQSIELVMTGPSTPFVATRRTEQVLLDVIRQAKCELFLVSFVAKNWTRVIDELAIADARGVMIDVLIEASKKDGGTLESDQSRELVKAIPRARIYSWTKKDAEHIGGRVHAKIAIADKSTAFITSANLTGHAMEKNIEAGVLIQGGDLPADLAGHLRGLIELKIITAAT